MKLYIYDHCPFCVRTEMVANYKGISYESISLLYDDEASCYALINAKQLPILEFDDGKAMPESLDIAHKFDEMSNPEKIIAPEQKADAIVKHMDTVAMHMRYLTYPRYIMANLPEFATSSAKNYFQKKKEISMGYSFQQAMQETSRHKETVEKMLVTLPRLPTAHPNNMLSWDDVLIYPTLRNLTIIKHLQFPEHVLNYIENIKNITHTHTYFDRAVP